MKKKPLDENLAKHLKVVEEPTPDITKCTPIDSKSIVIPGSFVDLPEKADDTHELFELCVKELEIEKVEPQPKAGEQFYCKDGHLYCFADSVESADEVFCAMMKSLVVAQTPIRTIEKPKILKPPGKIVHPAPTGSLFLPKKKGYN